MDYASHTVIRRGVRFVSATACVVAVTACAPADADLSFSFTLQALPSPAGEGSGEPFLSPVDDGVVLSWLEPTEGRMHELRFAKLGPGGWSPVATVAKSDAFFVNWADFPSLTEVAPGRLVAHWLQRGGAGTYDYGVRVVESLDGGASWSEPWTPHEDATPTEHGFVSTFPLQGGWGLVWLDGRSFHAPEGAEPTNEMALRFRALGPNGPGPEIVVDGRVCECCQTAVATTRSGPIVAYRNRTLDEVRDIHVSRWVDGSWTEGVAVHDDGWHIEACPVNGPSLAADGDRVAIAWFTGAGDQPRVQAAISTDGGVTFSGPIVVDDGNPGGRVDVVLAPGGSALVSWLERTGDGDAEVRVRQVWLDGRSGASAALATSAGARASGFPRMALAPDGSLVYAWTDVSAGGSRVKVGRAHLEPR